MPMLPAPPLTVDPRWLRSQWATIVLTTALTLWFAALGLWLSSATASQIRADEHVLATGLAGSRVVVVPRALGEEWPFRKYVFDVTWRTTEGTIAKEVLEYRTFHGRLAHDDAPGLRYDPVTGHAALAWAESASGWRWLHALVHLAVGCFVAGLAAHFGPRKLLRQLRDVRRCAVSGKERQARVVDVEKVNFGSRYRFAVDGPGAKGEHEIATLLGIEGDEPIFVDEARKVLLVLVAGTSVVAPTINVVTTELRPFTLTDAQRELLFTRLARDPRTAEARIRGVARVGASAVIGTIRSFLGL
jgi:hypothetical protein